MAEPLVVLTYGPSGVGKSVDMGYSFPTALFLAAPGAMQSVRSVCGYEPQWAEVKTIMDVTSLLPNVKKKFKAIVIDDFSFLAEQTQAALETKYTGFKLWGALRDVVLDFRDKSRYAGIDVIANAWEGAPKTNPAGARIRGGPKLSGQLPEQLPAMCDIVLRATPEPRREPWPAVYRCTLDSSFIMKDRLNIVPRLDPAPMNLAEILRASGHEVDRREDMPDLEKRVQDISLTFTGEVSKDIILANQIYSKLVESGVSDTEATWTLRDALDRAVIRKGLAAAKSTFIRPRTTLG